MICSAVPVQTKVAPLSLWALRYSSTSDQVGDGMEHVAPQSLVGQFPEPPFDEVEPGRGSRGEMQVEPGICFQPGPSRRGVYGWHSCPESYVPQALSGPAVRWFGE